MSKEIPLRNGGVALVDDSDYPTLSAFEWSRLRRGYVGRTIYDRVSKKTTLIYMHCELLAVAAGREVDHVDRNRLNNQRSNLRPATHSQNLANQAGHPRRSKFKGVYIHPEISRARARISIAGNKLDLGSFRTEEKAARAYDAAARKHYGEFACTNFAAG